MKRFLLCFMVLFFFINNNVVFSQEDSDDVPYLSDDDIAAIEIVLPDDIPEIMQENVKELAAESRGGEPNEVSRLNTSQTIFHLLILDRTYCQLNSDIKGIDKKDIIYMYRHGANGYLIAVYKSPEAGPVFPRFPDNSRILVNLTTVRKSTIKEFINSSSFKKFVTSRKITTDILKAVNNIK